MDQELDNSQVKIKVLTKKFTANINTLSKAKEAPQLELTKPHTLTFLQVRARWIVMLYLFMSE